MGSSSSSGEGPLHDDDHSDEWGVPGAAAVEGEIEIVERESLAVFLAAPRRGDNYSLLDVR